MEWSYNLRIQLDSKTFPLKKHLLGFNLEFISELTNAVLFSKWKEILKM